MDTDKSHGEGVQNKRKLNVAEQIPQHILDLLLNVILDVMKSKSGSIMLTDGRSPELTIQSAKGLKKEIIERTHARLGFGVAGKVATDDSAIYIRGDAKERRDRIDPEDLTRKDIDHSFIIPLKLGDGKLGTLNINAMDLTQSELAEKHLLVQDIVSRFYTYLVNTEIPPAHHSPPSKLHMMNMFREYNVLRELRIVFDYIFQIITDVSGIQKKGVFFLKDKDSTYFELVLGYGIESGSHRDLYEKLAPSIQARLPEPPHYMEIFNRADLALNSQIALFNEEFVVVFPLRSAEGKRSSQGQLVLFHHEKPVIDKEQEIILKTISTRAAETIETSNVNQGFRDLTYTDSLTCTYNYGLWWKRLNEEFSRLQREKKGIISLLLVDVDQFNKVNLTHGYYAGDQILRFIADKILGCVRVNDVVGRIGGEEFGVILLQSSKESAQMIAKRILEAVQNLSDEMHLNLKSPITLSGGIAGFPMDADTPESLVQKAQTAIVSAKIMGGNVIKLFDHMEE